MAAAYRATRADAKQRTDAHESDRRARIGGPIFALPLLVACAGKIDRFTVDRVVPAGNAVADTGKACALGAALVHPIDALSKGRSELALAVAEGTGALCAEQEAWEADLTALRARTYDGESDEARAAAITDATLSAERHHAIAAARFDRAFGAIEDEWGTVGDGCPKIAERDEFVYFFGLVCGTLALLHDRASGGVHDVPLDRLGAVARGAGCVDDARWWSGPAALRAGAWATVPGLGPTGTDPWAELETAAAAGDPTGVRVARAIQILIAANAGRNDVLEPALAAHAASREAVPSDPEWALLDEYAYRIALQESDRVWSAATGHRTERFGAWPGSADAPPEPLGPDPFATEAPVAIPTSPEVIP